MIIFIVVVVNKGGEDFGGGGASLCNLQYSGVFYGRKGGAGGMVWSSLIFSSLVVKDSFFLNNFSSISIGMAHWGSTRYIYRFEYDMVVNAQIWVTIKADRTPMTQYNHQTVQLHTSASASTSPSTSTSLWFKLTL